VNLGKKQLCGAIAQIERLLRAAAKKISAFNNVSEFPEAVKPVQNQKIVTNTLKTMIV
jgi:hypothetical protein